MLSQKYILYHFISVKWLSRWKWNTLTLCLPHTHTHAHFDGIPLNLWSRLWFFLCVHSVFRSFGAHLTIAVSNHTHVLLITICRLNSSTTATAAATKIRTTNDREIIVCFCFCFFFSFGFSLFIFPWRRHFLLGTSVDLCALKIITFYFW